METKDNGKVLSPLLLREICNPCHEVHEESQKKGRMNMQTKLKSKAIMILEIIAGIAIVAAIVIFAVRHQGKKAEVSIEKNTITVSTLEKIIDVSDLSTYTAVYNGVAEVMNDEEPEEIDYYVAYEAKVNAGIDFDKLKIDADNEAKIIEIEIPNVKITEIVVDISSMDYIFVNDSANGSTVTQDAYKACERDVENECEEQDAIYELAQENAKNVLSALVEPIISQMDPAYTVVIR